MTTDYGKWIGRSETREDLLAPGPVDRLNATLDHGAAAARAGDIAPPLAHWLCFLPDAPQSEIGADGHPRRGGFLPPAADLPRRMWAGSRIRFGGDLRIGMALRRVSTITAVERKEGRTGALLFVTVRHEIGERTGTALIIDEHDIVYRGLTGAAAKPPAPAAGKGDWQREIMPDPVLLFRYSALTFNGHRIHYDRDYATREEGYPGLVVHGPLQATLLIDLLGRNLPGRRVKRFSFRAMSPAFDGHKLGLHGTTPDQEGRVGLFAVNEEGAVTMTAEAIVA